jgi:RNA polymerase sigma factor (sigma-70 family)
MKMRAFRTVAAQDDAASRLDDDLVGRLYREAKAERWAVTRDDFARALAASLARTDAAMLTPREIERHLSSLHLEDLALACACAAGIEAAWDYFVAEHRPVLYRSADALDPGGGAREIADALYGDLYGTREREGERRSLFRYFHGRSSLATWLRAVLAQRYVDALRSRRRLEPLPEEDSDTALRGHPLDDPDRVKYVALMHRALGAAVARLPARDRMRLGLYYGQQLTLADAGRVLGEHAATVSRQLARSRRFIRQTVETLLREARLTADEIERCYACATEDSGAMDLEELLRSEGDRKIVRPDRSK